MKRSPVSGVPQSLKILKQKFGSLFTYLYLCNWRDRIDFMQRPEIVKQIKEKMMKTEPTATTILYGSEARGDARPDSDIDLLILLEGDRRDLRKESEISGALYDIELESGILISPMIMLRKQWDNRPFKTPFYINVMNEGIRL